MSDEWVVTMPKLGETVTEGLVGNWLKQVGDEVAFDDPLFEVSTDKVDSEIPSPYDGVVAEILVAAGETVPVGTPLVRITPAGVVVENRIPAASHTVAAAGGPSLSDPAAPQMGGSEGTAGEDPGVGAPTGEVHDITMPKLGETVTEGTIGNWLKQAGDPVAFDDPLFEVSTDKVDSEIPSPYDGVLLEILVPAGDTVPVGTPLARIGAPGGAVAGATAAPAPAAAAAGPPASAGAAPAGNGSDGRMLSPLVRRLAAEGGLDLATVTGTGAGGRIRREDVERALATGGARAAAAPSAAQAAPAAAAAPAPPAAAP
ncbi:biotin/lipoyl-containing protein, partial [Pseudonocardia sp. H11422]|uniref:biotin/lipoyl-containing protein n=1 Tax=Pseudonocardia sp. H11422 TaxID=2835866 RepID=UPI00292D39DC